jgi:hypothetical protein
LAVVVSAAAVVTIVGLLSRGRGATGGTEPAAVVAVDAGGPVAVNAAPDAAGAAAAPLDAVVATATAIDGGAVASGEVKPDAAAAAAPPDAATAIAKASPDAAPPAVDHPTGPSTKDLERKALSQYKDKQWEKAAATMKAASKSTSGREAKKLASRSADMVAVGGAIARGDASAKGNPGAAMAAYEEALSLDGRAGKGAHAKWLKEQLAKLAPKSAAAHLAAKRYEQAKAACDAAASYGAGKDPQVVKVLGQLEVKAKALYAEGRQLYKTKPAQAKADFNLVLKIVPPSSEWFKKSTEALKTIK